MVDLEPHRGVDRALARALILGAVTGGGIACFGGEGAQGLVCDRDDDCGPALRCVDGRCEGGRERDALCGNGLLEPGEDCDDGNLDDGDVCTSVCTSPRCGDGFVSAGELCDDGNGCSSTCDSVCGDGLVSGFEACDDGNLEEGDACTPTCALPSCGDGFLAPGEDCDDGNLADGDSCTSMCTDPRCGDGLLALGELCDDGNDDETDACTTSCAAPSCTDALVSGDETDLDCGGSCGGCSIGRSCVDDGDCEHEACVDQTCVEIVREVVAGGEATCALLNTGARCWGRGELGQLGYGNLASIGDNEEPALAGLVDLGLAPTQLAMTTLRACARLEGGFVRCWGDNEYDYLGHDHDGNIGDDETPGSLAVITVGGPVVQVATGSKHACALLDDGAVRCWGWNGFGMLGYPNAGPIGDDERVYTAGDVRLGGPAKQLSLGTEHSCAVLVDGAVRCWGKGSSGRLGTGSFEDIGDDEDPEDVDLVAVGGPVVQVEAGDWHTCALLEGGTVRCWGASSYGALGHGSGSVGTVVHPEDSGDVDLGGTVTQIASESHHTCALLEGGAVRCWGWNNFGQLGYGHTETIGDDEVPSADVEVGGPAVGVTTGRSHSCAVLAGGSVRCWGRNERGQLGYGHTETIGDDEVPASVGDVPCTLP